MNKLYIMEANDCLEQIENETISVIYIDPPYNTKSKNFEYNDNFKNWNEMIEILLKKSYFKLLEKGCIFISIDDNKLFELKLICDKIFGNSNYLGLFITKQATRSNSNHINTIHEYVLCYAKNKTKLKKFKIYRRDLPYYKKTINSLMISVKEIFDEMGLEYAEVYLKNKIKELIKDESYSWIKNYNLIDENGEIFFAKDLSIPSKPKELYIEELDLKLPKLKTRGWSSEKKIKKLFTENRIMFKGERPYEKHYLYESQDNVMSILNFYSRQGKHDLDKLGLKDIFNTPKPVEMIKYLIKISSQNNDVILDFFAGSGTTAQAVIELNNEENTNRSFILCQNEEKIKNNKNAIKILRENKLKINISGITVLRLEKLKQFHKFNYEIIS